MKPIIFIVLIFVGLLSAFFLQDQLTTAQVATGGATNGASANYTSLAIKILMVIMVLYAIYYVVDVIKTSARERRALERKKKMLEAREESYKS